MSSTTGFARRGTKIVPRVTRVAGRLRVPGDKSISHRYAMLAAIADGTSRLTGYAPGADCAATLACLEALGVRITRAAGTITIEGLGLGGLRAPAGPLDAANSGTSMRLLAGLLAPHPFRTVIGGDASLSRRPMRRVIEPLTRDGRLHHRRGRPAAADDRRHGPARNFPRARGAERTGEKRGPARRAARAGTHDRRRAGPHTGSYGAGPACVRRSRDSRQRGGVGRGRPAACAPSTPPIPGRHLVRRVLARPGRGHARVRSLRRRGRLEPIAHRRCSMCCAGPGRRSS